MRGRLLASSMITGAAALVLGVAAAQAADSTSSSDVVTTGGQGAISTPASGSIKTVTATAEATATAQTSEIVVTGSRIPRPNLTSVSPIQAVTHQEFQLGGHTDVIDLLNTLPQNFQNNVSDFSNTSNPLNGPGGTTTADLRGLGPQRTLVLVNGRRLGIGDANTGNPNPAPDLDQIPVSMIDHVEVLTGGASSVYGSDAMAGVVNFILKKDFEGIQVDGTLGVDQHNQHNGFVQSAIRAAQAGGLVGPLSIPPDRWDGGNENGSIIMGANAPDGRGNATVYFEYSNRDPVKQGNRDWSACFLLDSSVPNSQFCSGSSNSNRFAPRAGGVFTVAGNGFAKYPQLNTSPPAIFNSNPYEYLSRGDTRYVAGYLAHYDFSNALSVYSEFNFMDDRTTVQIAPSGLFRGGNPFDTFGDWQINCNNPFLNAASAADIGCAGADFTTVGAGTAASPQGALKEVQIGRRNIEGGPRQSYYEHFNYRALAGIRGDFGQDNALHYDVYGSYYYTFLYQNNSNYLSNSKIGNALDVVSVAGVPTCVGVLNQTAPGCVPYNILQSGGVTQAALNYLTESGTQSGSVEEQIVEGDFTGDLGKYGIKSPWATDGIGVALGWDWRHDQLLFLPDAIIGSGDLGGGSGVGQPVNAGIGVWEGYGEANIPIVQDMPWAKLLELTGGLRYSTYSGSAGAKFTATTYKIGMQWSPIEDIRFRGSYNRAIRAPSVIELFNPPTVSQISFADPCATAAPVYTVAQCARTFGTVPGGLPAGFYGNTNNQCPANQCDQILGGNSALKPETADTFTVGATFTPHWVRGLNFSVDWWDIMEYGFVGPPGSPGNIFNDCALNNNPTSCAEIHRAPATGNLFGPSNIANGGYISQLAINVNNGQTMGIDFQGDYRLELEDLGAKNAGSLSFAFNGSYLLKNASFTGGTTQDCAGLFGPLCQTVNPHWRHLFRVTWNSPWNALFSLQWRYIGGTTLDLNQFQAAGITGNSAALPDYSYLDLASEWRINTHFTVRAGVNNVLDTDPPIVSTGVSGIGTPNTYPTYDLLGRELFVSGTMRF
jgi:outer membrane receptor protein involved in Fe transport